MVSRIDLITEKHPYLNSGAARAMLVYAWSNLSGHDVARQADMDEYTETLMNMTEEEILNHRSFVSEQFHVSLDEFNDNSTMDDYVTGQ